MLFFRQSLIHIKAKPVTIGELFDIALPAVIAHAVRAGIFNY